MSIPDQGHRLINLIRGVDKCQHSIIAGGYCRDALLDAPFKDIDIFIPCRNFGSFKVAAEKLREAGIFSDMSDWQENGYRELSPMFLGLYNCKFEGQDVQFIGYQMDEEDFPTELIGDFHFYIDKVAYDGTEMIISHRHELDVRNRTLTLCKLSSTAELPNSMRKFERLHAKFPAYRFATTIELIEGAPKMPKSIRPITPIYQTIPYTSPAPTLRSQGWSATASLEESDEVIEWPTPVDPTDGTDVTW